MGINMDKITYKTVNGWKFPVRSLLMPNGSLWVVSDEFTESDDRMTDEVDDTIAFFFSSQELLHSTDDELRDIIGDCT